MGGNVVVVGIAVNPLFRTPELDGFVLATGEGEEQKCIGGPLNVF